MKTALIDATAAGTVKLAELDGNPARGSDPCSFTLMAR